MSLHSVLDSYFYDKFYPGYQPDTISISLAYTSLFFTTLTIKCITITITITKYIYFIHNSANN